MATIHDRNLIYQAVGLTAHYRRNGSTEEVKLTTTPLSVDLERVGADGVLRTPRPQGYRAWTWIVSEGGLQPASGRLQPSPFDRVEGSTSYLYCHHGVDRPASKSRLASKLIAPSRSISLCASGVLDRFRTVQGGPPQTLNRGYWSGQFSAAHENLSAFASLLQS
jgi:hypothetical protein